MTRFKALALFSLAVSSLRAEGTVRASTAQLGNTSNYVVSFDYTGDASTGSVPATIAPSLAPLAGYRVIAAEHAPQSPTPTNGFSLKLNNTSGVDLLGGAATSVQTASGQSYAAPSASPPLLGTFSLVITGQNVASAKGRVLVYLGPISQMIGLPPTATTTPAQTIPGYLYARNYGVLCDGVTDDATNIQAALNASTLGQAVQLPGGTCLIGSQLTMSNQGTFLIGTPVANGVGNPANVQGTILKQKNGANLQAMVRLTSSLQGLKDLVIDGNKANNSSALDGIVITASRAQIDHVTSQLHKRDGMRLVSTGSNQEACCAKIIGSMFIANDGHGVNQIYTADGFWLQTEFENNALDGWHGNGAATNRFVNCDFSGNSNDGWDNSSDTTAAVASRNHVIGSNFGGNLNHDVKLNGYSGASLVGEKNEFIDNVFIGGPRTANTYDALNIVDSPSNLLDANVFEGGTAFRYFMNITETAGGRSAYGILSMNSSGSTVGTACLQATSLTARIGNCPALGEPSYFVTPIRTVGLAFASAPTCNAAMEGAMLFITDSNTATWGANIAGGGANKVSGFCNGTNWTVAGK